jgi:uncharacterized membrane protein YphA (DoxX/SURF4 family)
MNLLFIASLFITLLFFLSGFNKIKDFNQVTKGFVNKTKIPLFLSKIVISGVILLEIIAPLIITLYSYNLNKSLYPYTKLSLIGLIIFTILATLIYHFPPVGSNYYSFTSNLSTIGGLILLYLYF